MNYNSTIYLYVIELYIVVFFLQIYLNAKIRNPKKNAFTTFITEFGSFEL